MSESKDNLQVYDSDKTFNLTFANAHDVGRDANVKFVPLVAAHSTAQGGFPNYRIGESWAIAAASFQ